MQLYVRVGDIWKKCREYKNIEYPLLLSISYIVKQI